MSKKLQYSLVILSINLLFFVTADLLFAFFYKAEAPYLNTAFRTYSADNKKAVFDKLGITVLGFGDSFTSGQGVKAHETWIKRLEKISPSKKIYGVNFGQQGANIPEVSQLFQKEILNYEPDLVVYALVLNDVFHFPREPFALDTNPAIKDDSPIKYDFINLRTKNFDQTRLPFINFFYEYSSIARFIIRTYEIKKTTRNTINYYQKLHDPKYNGEGLLKTFELIEQMHSQSLKRKSQFVVMIFPLFYNTEGDYPFVLAHKYLRDSLNKRGIAVLDLWPYYKGKLDEDLWVHPVDQHPNSIALGIAAKALYQWMEKNLISF